LLTADGGAAASRIVGRVRPNVERSRVLWRRDHQCEGSWPRPRARWSRNGQS